MRTALPSLRTSTLRRPAAVLAAFVLAFLGLVAIPVPAAHATGASVELEVTESGTVLAGDTASLVVTARNSSGVDGFNLVVTALVPVGIEFVSAGSWGAPHEYGHGDLLDGGHSLVPEGARLWVWEDVSDLPASGANSVTIEVRPAQPARSGGQSADPTVFPVGSVFDIELGAALSTDPRYLPAIDGSSGLGDDAAQAATVTARAASSSWQVNALEVTKTEPSPESELLRGVHDRSTVYTVEVRTTSEGDAADAVLVDFLPAGLEFLACGQVDFSTRVTQEYDGAPGLEETPAVPAMGAYSGSPLFAEGCLEPFSVETVQGDPDAPSDDVFTKVVWHLGDLPAGSVTRVQYAAGIPLRENTMTWDAPVGGPETGEQAANLDNNNGPSTRQGLGADRAVDGAVWTNLARAVGEYEGVVRPGTGRTSSDEDQEMVHAMDLAVQKAREGGPETFVTGQTARFSLTLRASEYTDASQIVLVDRLPNGLCPLLPAGQTIVYDDDVHPSAECPAGTGTVTGGAIISATGHADGTFTLVIEPSGGALAAGGDTVVTYEAFMRPHYVRAGRVGATTSGDAFENVVEVTATTTSVLSAQDLVAHPDENGTERVWDDSLVQLGSELTEISKRVMPRDEVEVDASGDPCTSGSFAAGTASGFRLGDTVCFELVVEFPDSIDTRGARVTDLIPAGIALEGWQVAGGSTVPEDQLELVADGARLVWEVGTLDTESGVRFVDRGSRLVLHVWGTVDSASPMSGQFDKPENLMKYQQFNAEGELFFLRAQAGIEVDPTLNLVKGVHDVDDDMVRPADTDGVEVREGADVTYRIDLTTEHSHVAVDVRDVLPARFDDASVADVSHQGAVLRPGQAGYPSVAELGADHGRTLVVWDEVPLDRGDTTLTYTVTVPAGTPVSSRHVNTAAVTRLVYHVNGSHDPIVLTPGEDVDGTFMVDDSDVHLPDAAVTKSVTSPTDTNNTVGQVVKGEVAKFTYTVTVPARTTVHDGVLTDVFGTPGNWVVLSDRTQVSYPAGTTTSAGTTEPGAESFEVDGLEFEVDPATGTLTFPAVYDNKTDADQTFTVTLHAYVDPDAGWGHSPTTARANEARFVSDGLPARTARAQTFVIAPAPTLTKLADTAEVAGGDTVKYRLQATNSSGRPTLFDTVVTDCVPAELTDVTLLTVPDSTTASLSTSGSAGCPPGRTLITWQVGALEGGSSVELVFEAKIVEDAVAGAVYRNEAFLEGFGLDDDDAPRERITRSAARDVTVLGASIDKQVDATHAVIGERRGYTVTVTLPAHVTFYGLQVSDTPPPGLAISDVTWNSVLPEPARSGAGTVADPFTWTIGDVSASGEERTIEITYTGTVHDVESNLSGARLTNTARVEWRTDPAGSDPVVDTDSASVTVREPAVTIDKRVDHPGAGDAAREAIDVDAGGGFRYAVRVESTGTSTAYDVEVVDTVPAGVVVDPDSISHGGVLTGVDATVGGGTITWRIGSLGVGQVRTFTYAASLASSAHLDGSTLENVADVTEFFSHPGDTSGFDDDQRRQYDGPQDDASVTPLFPEPTVTKTVDAAVTALGEPVTFEIVVENEGDSPLTTYRVTDELPAGWTVSDVSPAPAAQSGTVATGLTLEWTGGPIAVGGSVTITYEATPDADHPWTTDDLGLAKAHTNVVVVRGKDGSGASGHLDPTGDPVTYEDEDDAVVNVPLANLALTKTVLTDPDDVVAGEPVTWALDVRNLGPDDEAGPVTITDEVPAGVIADAAADLTVTGTGWSLDSYDAASRTLTLVHAGGVAAPSVGGPGAIPRVTVTAVVDPGFVPDGSTSRALANSASVVGTTDELVTDNNDDDASAEVRASADLELVKKAVTDAYVPGRFITWEIDVTNHGPSVSRTPFTVTDTLPAEVDPTTFELLSGADWSVVGGAPVGDEVTFTYSGDDLDVDDATSTLRFRVKVRSNLLTTDPIVNVATVTPRTPDEDPTNNDDESPVGHGTSLADLSLAKTLVSDELVAGESGRYRLAVANAGPSYAVDVVVTDTLPEGLRYAGGLTSAPGDTWVLDEEVVHPDGTSTLTFVLDSGAGMLPDGASSWFELDVDVASWVTEEVTNTAGVSATTPDPDPSNNPDEETSTPLVETNLSVTKEHEEAVRRVGDTVVFTLTVTNHGPADAADVVLRDALPAGLTFEGLTDVLSASDGRTWVVDVVDDELEARLDGTLAAGEDAVVEVTAVLTPASFPEVTNRVTVTTSTHETDLDDNVDEDLVPVDSPDLRVVKTAGAESVQGGDELVYTIVVTNHGGAHADEATLTETLPGELELVSATWDDSDPAYAVGEVCELTGASEDGLGGTLECVLADGLAAGRSATLVVTLAVPADVAVDEVTNTVAVASDDEDPSLRGDNDDEVTTPVRWMQVAAHAVCVAEAPWLDWTAELHNVAAGEDLVLEWYADVDGDGEPDGEPVRTQVLATSEGDLMAGRVLWPGAEVDEDGLATLLPGLRPVERGETATWEDLVEDETLPEHALRGDVVLRFAVNPERSVGLAFPPMTPECLVDRSADLEVTKVADVERLAPGDAVTYTIETRSTGNGAARDVVVTDTVPAALKVERVTTGEPEDARGAAWAGCTVEGADARGYGGTVTCELDGVLPRGQAAPHVTVLATVDPEAGPGPVVNVAEVRWLDSDEHVVEDEAEVEVVPEDELATTGAELLGMLGVAAVLVLLGAGLVLVVRARRA